MAGTTCPKCGCQVFDPYQGFTQIHDVERCAGNGFFTYTVDPPGVVDVPSMAEQMLARNFTYHPPKGDQSNRYEIIRDSAKDFAERILAFVPESRERSLAITKLEEAVMWANAGIARSGA